ncbi:hypothetical protein Tco_0127581 [Tanacetum coccineum]
MAGPIVGNAVARRVIDDLVDISGETSVDGYMRFFKAQQVVETRLFVNRMREEAQTSRNMIGQLTALVAEMEAFDDPGEVFDTLMRLRDDIRVEEAKLVGLNDLITQAEEEIKMKEAQLECYECLGFILPNHDTGKILLAESQRNTIDPSVAVTDSSATDYDSADKSLVCSTPLPPLKKLDGVIINEPSSAPAKGNKSSSASKVNSAPVGKLKSVKIEDDPPLAIVIKELNDLKLQISKNQSSYSRSNQPQQCKRTDHITCDHAEYISTMNMSYHLKSLGRSSSRSKIPRPSKRFFPPCIHCWDLRFDDYKTTYEEKKKDETTRT